MLAATDWSLSQLRRLQKPTDAGSVYLYMTHHKTDETDHLYEWSQYGRRNATSWEVDGHRAPRTTRKQETTAVDDEFI